MASEYYYILKEPGVHGGMTNTKGWDKEKYTVNLHHLSGNSTLRMMGICQRERGARLTKSLVAKLEQFEQLNK